MIDLDDKTLEKLRDHAKSVSEHAYCPYSKFRVGAAVLGGSGKIYPGCNVENASYGLTICAERVAAGRAVAEGETEIKAVAIYTPTLNPTMLATSPSALSRSAWSLVARPKP